MPNTASAKKRLRQNELRRVRNRMTKARLRTQLRKVRQAVAGGELETAEREYRDAARQLDRAGSRKIIHVNAAARTKSRLQRLIKTIKT